MIEKGAFSSDSSRREVIAGATGVAAIGMFACSAAVAQSRTALENRGQPVSANPPVP